MARVKTAVAAHAKRKRTLKKVKGQFGFRKNSYKIAKQALRKANTYAFVDRKQKKRDFRKL